MSLCLSESTMQINKQNKTNFQLSASFLLLLDLQPSFSAVVTSSLMRCVLLIADTIKMPKLAHSACVCAEPSRFGGLLGTPAPPPRGRPPTTSGPRCVLFVCCRSQSRVKDDKIAFEREFGVPKSSGIDFAK